MIILLVILAWLFWHRSTISIIRLLLLLMRLFSLHLFLLLLWRLMLMLISMLMWIIVIFVFHVWIFIRIYMMGWTLFWILLYFLVEKIFTKGIWLELQAGWLSILIVGHLLFKYHLFFGIYYLHLLYIYTSVSYTHLDVYKRQEQKIGVWAIRTLANYSKNG